MTFRSLLELDARLSDRIRVAEKPGLLRALSVFFAHSGDSWYWAVGLVLVILKGTLAWKQWALIQLLGILGLAALVLAVKFLVRRRRPEGEWGGIYRNTDPHSFPSGHAARSFLIAVLASALGPGWLALLLWPWAPLVALARVAMGLHYLSDVLAGIFIGIAGALIYLQIYSPFVAWIAAWFPAWPVT